MSPIVEMPRRRRLAALFFAVLPVALAAFLLARPMDGWAMMEGISTEELARGSELIVVGDVQSAAARFTDDRSAIVTTAVVAVTEVIKGRRDGGNIEVEVRGGEVGDLGMMVSDEPRIAKGEKVLLFLKGVARPDGTRGFRLVGKAQGKYSIGRDGVARKKGFSVAGDSKRIDAEIPLDALVEKIRRAR